MYIFKSQFRMVVMILPSKFTHQEQVHTPCLIRRRRGQRSTRHVNGVKGSAVFIKGICPPKQTWLGNIGYVDTNIWTIQNACVQSHDIQVDTVGFPHMGYHNPWYPGSTTREDKSKRVCTIIILNGSSGWCFRAYFIHAPNGPLISTRLVRVLLVLPNLLGIIIIIQ